MNWYKFSQKRISYSGIILDADSKSKLLDVIPEELIERYDDVISHHMTINMGALEDKTDLGKEVGIVATHIGRSDKALAVKVSGYPSKNRTPHVTVAVNRKKGGSPKDSNEIQEWQPLSEGVYLRGRVEEV
ncbi:MAG: hypothetical protein H8E55_46495 [Pelagibacterales bacterium]|nr:hypothetical protein [Pelagibacterales bacterium]